MNPFKCGSVIEVYSFNVAQYINGSASLKSNGNFNQRNAIMYATLIAQEVKGRFHLVNFSKLNSNYRWQFKHSSNSCGSAFTLSIAISEVEEDGTLALECTSANLKTCVCALDDISTFKSDLTLAVKNFMCPKPTKLWTESIPVGGVIGLATTSLDENEWLGNGGDINLNIIRLTSQGSSSIFANGTATTSFECSLRSAYCIIEQEVEKMAMSDEYKHLKDRLYSKKMIFETIDEFDFDGPSGEVVAVCCEMSAILNLPIENGFEIAMTGAVQIDGSVTAVGGIEAKVWAAWKSGCKRAIVPAANDHQVKEISSKISSEIIISQIHNCEELLRICFPQIFQ